MSDQIESEKKNIFTDEEIKNLAGFFEVLERIDRRLLSEGYTMPDGKLTPPQGDKARNG